MAKQEYTYKAPVTASEPTKKTIEGFSFGKINTMIAIGGIVLVILGFMMMAGGKSANPNEFNYSEIYSARRITLAPILIMIGFIAEMVAILWVPKNQQN